MSKSVSRRAVLGGVAAGVAGIALLPPSFVHARSTDLIELRRDLHRHPEGPGEERRTAAVVARRLRRAGLDVTTGVGGHGVVGVLAGSRRGRTVAYRADMDAVPPHGQIPGGTAAAHVCGHDLHTTIGVGVAEALARRRGRLAGTVVFVFQPAEETLAGAAAMLADGVFDRVRPAEIHALHCSSFPVGEFAVTGGVGFPGQDQGSVTLTGPDAGERALQLAARINALGTVSPPAGPAELDRLLTDLQTPDGPLASFVFMYAEAVDATVRFSYRCWPESRTGEVRNAIRGLAGATPVDFPNDPFPALVSPAREGEEIKRYLTRTLGPDRVSTLHAAIPFNGEDFALFANRMPSTYTCLGVRGPGTPIQDAWPHFGTFTPDERAIGHGVNVMAGWLTSRTQRGGEG